MEIFTENNSLFEQYLNTKAADSATDFAEEFAEYDCLWEEYATYPEDVVRMWTAPDGKEVDIGSWDAREAEAERYAALAKEDSAERLRKSKAFIEYAANRGVTLEDAISDRLRMYKNHVWVLLSKVNSYMAKLEKVSNNAQAENQRIITKLRTYTNIADRVDLDDLLVQLNKASVGAQDKRSTSMLQKTEKELETYYSANFKFWENLNLAEWVDANGNKINSQSKPNQVVPKDIADTQPVFIWDIYLDPIDKGTWCSAEKNYVGRYEGTVYETPLKAHNSAETHLEELEEEGELEGKADAYRIDIIAVPISQVDDMTLDWSGI